MVPSSTGLRATGNSRLFHPAHDRDIRNTQAQANRLQRCAGLVPPFDSSYPRAVHVDLGINPGFSDGRNPGCARSFTIQGNRSVLIEEGNNSLGNVARGCYLEDRLVRTNSHPAAQTVALQKAQEILKKPMRADQLKVGIPSWKGALAIRLRPPPAPEVA